MKSAEQLRSEFMLRPDVIFLNHGSFGARPRAVFEDYQRWQLELEKQPVEFLGARTRLLPDARAALAKYVDCERDDLVFVANATTGISTVARSLPLQPGDEILTNDHEYGACDRAWEFACRRSGAVYRKVPLPLPMEDPQEIVDAMFKAVTPRTRVIFVSHITSPTALIFPVPELVRRAKEAGIWSVVDGAHAPGQIELSMREIDADFYAGNLHKWLCAPPGTGYLYVRRSLQPLISPPITSWGRHIEPEHPNPFVDEFEWQGTRDISGFLAVPTAIRYLQENDWPAVRERCHALASWVRNEVADWTDLPDRTPDSPEWFAQMVALPLPPFDIPTLKRRLLEEERIEIPASAWQGSHQVRVSVQGYVTKADLEALVKALKRLVPECPPLAA